MSSIELPEFYETHMGKHRNLTAKEEYTLGTIIQSQKKLLPDPLPDDQKQRFAPQLREIQSALDKLVEANLRRVVKIAIEFRIKNPSLSNYDLDELVQIGNMVLIKAAERYDPARGYRFSVYVSEAIRRDFNEYVAQSRRVVALPFNFIMINWRINSIQEEYRQEYGMLPTAKTIAYQLSKILSANYTPEMVAKRIAYSARREISLNPGKEDDSVPIPLQDTRFKDPLEEAMDHDTQDLIGNCLNKLSERERIVLLYRFGLCGTTQKTLEEIAELIGCSRERVRQIEVRALKRMKYIISGTDEEALIMKGADQAEPQPQNPLRSNLSKNALSASTLLDYTKGRYRGDVLPSRQSRQLYSQTLATL